ncbi:hypothetical protein CRG98_046249 [Punica granatum]|uniref:Uncharacterized protein n=1 Tax=Punica granatum TaxID=22663 RepID=A0A2I0HPF7_PUNGR|nr:hypothetical protein CRG98_046249 [Punica granatum]
METGGGANKTCSEDRKVAGGRGTAMGAGGGGNWLVKGRTVNVCSVGGAGASMFSGAWVGGTQGVGFLDAQAYSPFGCSAQLDQFIEFTVSKRASRVQL